MESTLRRTWAEIDLDALAHNCRILRKQAGENARLLGVVKADAYGHGAVQIALALEREGADYLAVSNIDEARELRQGGVHMPILQLGLTPPDQTAQIIENRVTQTVYSEAIAREFSREAVCTGGRMKIHVKLDTGMSRLGFQCDGEHFQESLEAICRVCRLPGLEAEGIFTHFAAADSTDDASRDYTLVQHGLFQEMIRRLEERGITFAICHCANSGATVNYPQFARDMFRPGILIYGEGDGAERLGLRPILTLKSTVGAIKEYPAGVDISYGRTFRTSRPCRVGVLPIGYADGFQRTLSNRWKVWTPWGMAPVVGRICMDMCMVDLTDLPQVREGDEVEVYGAHNSVTRAAEMAGTIPYELICAISKRVTRSYRQGGREVARELLLRG